MIFCQGVQHSNSLDSFNQHVKQNFYLLHCGDCFLKRILVGRTCYVNRWTASIDERNNLWTIVSLAYFGYPCITVTTTTIGYYWNNAIQRSINSRTLCTPWVKTKDSILLPTTVRWRRSRNQNQKLARLSITNCATHCAIGRGVADPLELAPSHVCYYAKFGRSRSNRVPINREESLGVTPLWDEWRGSPPKNKPLPHVLPCKFGHSTCISRNMGTPKMGSAGFPPLERGGVADPRNSAPHMCYLADLVVPR